MGFNDLSDVAHGLLSQLRARVDVEEVTVERCAGGVRVRSRGRDGRGTVLEREAIAATAEAALLTLTMRYDQDDRLRDYAERPGS